MAKRSGCNFLLIQSRISTWADVEAEIWPLPIKNWLGYSDSDLLFELECIVSWTTATKRFLYSCIASRPALYDDLMVIYHRLLHEQLRNYKA
ncbi:hypothetical protein KAR91_20055 [Candidatus Pacearchaeota archaeon]|nr:hypothetical protein [Candidatus Pacearchaeota archaeon]